MGDREIVQLASCGNGPITGTREEVEEYISFLKATRTHFAWVREAYAERMAWLDEEEQAIHKKRAQLEADRAVAPSRIIETTRQIERALTHLRTMRQGVRFSAVRAKTPQEQLARIRDEVAALEAMLEEKADEILQEAG